MSWPSSGRRSPTRTSRAGLVRLYAIGTITKLWERHGEDHVRDVLACILEFENNRMALVKPIIGATSDLLLAHRHWWERDASLWLQVFDRVNLLVIHQTALPNKRACSPKDAIGHEMYRRLAVAFEPEFANLFGPEAET